MTLQTLFKTIALATPILMGSVDAAVPQRPEAEQQAFQRYLDSVSVPKRHEGCSAVCKGGHPGCKIRMKLTNSFRYSRLLDSEDRQIADQVSILRGRLDSIIDESEKEMQVNWRGGGFFETPHNVLLLIPFIYGGKAEWWNIWPVPQSDTDRIKSLSKEIFPDAHDDVLITPKGAPCSVM